MAEQVIISDAADWYDMWDNIAHEAAKARVESRKELYGSEADREAAVDSFRIDFRNRLDKKYPFEDYKDKDREQKFLQKWPADKYSKLLMAGDGELGGTNTKLYQDYDPMIAMQKKDFERVKSVLKGVADEGKDWTAMDSEMLKDKAREAGFSDLGQFMNLVSKNQIVLDRARQYKDFQNSTSFFNDPVMFGASIAYPTMFEEAGKQIATGEGTEGDLLAAGALDFGVNTLQMAAPGIEYIKTADLPARGARQVSELNSLARAWNPISINPFVASVGKQAAEEGVRQGGKLLIDSELDPSLLAILGAGTAGATVPGASLALQGRAGKLGAGEASKDFAKGFMKGTRFTDPVELERKSIEQAWPAYAAARGDRLAAVQTGVVPNADKYGPLTVNPEAANMAYDSFMLNRGEFAPTDLNLAAPHVVNSRPVRDLTNSEAKAADPTPMLDMMRALGVRGDDELWSMKRELKDIQNRFDEQLGLTKYPTIEGRPVNELDAAEIALQDRYFPAKLAENGMSNNAPYARGEKLGRVTSDVFGRVEPTFKVNPVTGPTNSLTNYLSGKEEAADNSYENTSWFLNMKPWQQKLFREEMDRKKKDMVNDSYNLELLGIK